MTFCDVFSTENVLWYSPYSERYLRAFCTCNLNGRCFVMSSLRRTSCGIALTVNVIWGHFVRVTLTEDVLWCLLFGGRLAMNIICGHFVHATKRTFCDVFFTEDVLWRNFYGGRFFCFFLLELYGRRFMSSPLGKTFYGVTFWEDIFWCSLYGGRFVV